MDASRYPNLCVTRTIDPSLGDLSLLPPEVRLQIWDLFSVHPLQLIGYTDYSRRPGRLALLRTSRRIYAEVSTHLYKDVVLRFLVSPTFRYRSWLTVKSNAGSSWHLEALNSPGVSERWGKLPYEKLREVHVEIDAPCCQDPGQLVCLWNKCFDLSELLEKAKRGIQRLEIHFKDSQSAKWSTNGRPQMILEIPGNGFKNDYEILLTAFYRLRKVRKALVWLPEDRCGNSGLASRMVAMLEQEQAFGIWDDIWNDKSLQDKQDRAFMNLYCDLDKLPGITASMMHGFLGGLQFVAYRRLRQRIKIREEARKDLGG